MDKIVLQNMRFRGYHGCEVFEQQNGQPFEVDLELFVDVAPAAKSDQLDDAVDYVKVFRIAQTIVENERFNLLESLASKIADCVLHEPRIQEIIVRIRKPAVPLPGLLDGVQIEIRRGKK